MTKGGDLRHPDFYKIFPNFARGLAKLRITTAIVRFAPPPCFLPPCSLSPAYHLPRINNTISNTWHPSGKGFTITRRDRRYSIRSSVYTTRIIIILHNTFVCGCVHLFPVTIPSILLRVHYAGVCRNMGIQFIR